MNICNVRYIFHAHRMYLNTFRAFIDTSDKCPLESVPGPTPEHLSLCLSSRCYYQNASQCHFHNDPSKKFLPDLSTKNCSSWNWIYFNLWTLWMVALTRFLSLPWLLRSFKLNVWPTQSVLLGVACNVASFLTPFYNPHPWVSFTLTFHSYALYPRFSCYSP